MSTVDWLEVHVQGPAAQAPEAEIALQGLGFPGWVDQSGGDGDGFHYLCYLPQEPGWEERLRALRGTGLTCRTGGQVRDEDWAENWKRFYHPLVVGRRLVICPSWEKFEPTSEQLVITLDPGSAFGTGYHWSTRLCLELLEQLPAAGSVLDLGTGSGILAIASYRLGWREIHAVDNDPVAVKVARENIDLNHVPATVEVGSGPPKGQANQLVLANLVASLLIELAERLFAAVEPGGHLICGGIIQEREPETLAALQAAGLRLVEARRQEDWVGLLLQRP